MAVWLCSEGLRWSSCCGPYFRHYRWLQQLCKFKKYLDLGQMLSHYSHYRGVPMKPNGTNHTIHSEGKSKDDTQWVFSHVLSVSHDSEMGLSTGKSFVTCKWFLTSLKVSWNHLVDLKLRTLTSNGHFCGSWLESLWDKITIPIQFLDIPSTASAYHVSWVLEHYCSKVIIVEQLVQIDPFIDFHHCLPSIRAVYSRNEWHQTSNDKRTTNTN